MNLQVDLERQKPEDVAQQFLEDKGLLERRQADIGPAGRR